MVKRKETEDDLEESISAENSSEESSSEDVCKSYTLFGLSLI